MTVRAKFKLVEKTPEGTLRFDTVYGGAENAAFFRYTPWGSISMGVVNPSALEQFEVGQEYYVDFTQAQAD